MGARYICLFNHKGGVSKTTTAFHLAWKLTDVGKRVLLVDADSQCNLTGLVLGNKLDAFYQNTGTRSDNLYSALQNIFLGNATSPAKINCPFATNNAHLYLLPGHPDVATFEGALGLALSGAPAFISQQNQPGSFYALIEQCCQSNAIDYVLIDMNPALSSLNKIFFSMCDGFILPTVPDPFCAMALKSLTKILPVWKHEVSLFINNHPAANLKLPTKGTYFIGEIIQRYSLRNQQPSKSYEMSIVEIKSIVQNMLVPALQSAGMMFPTSSTLPKNTANCIAQMPEFLSLLQKANALQKPVFAITDSEIGGGAILENLGKKRDSINSTFESLANLILTLLP